MKTTRRDPLDRLADTLRRAVCPAVQIAADAPAIPLATVLLMIGRLKRRKARR